MIRSLLGGLTPQQFLERHWQKKPLLVRNAIPDFTGFVDANDAKALAGDEDSESRLVWRDKTGWQLARGPLRPRDFPRAGPWTVLIQGLNLILPEADDLLREFAFIPYARLDDVMVSYATDGGGVGPHFDSYDVFLLQGSGQRRWQIGAQRDLTLVEDAPLRILKNFRPTQEWILNPGDMLYLPPRYAHNGIAIGECTTYSIGFRAPSVQELATEFLAFMQERIALPGMYADPHLRHTRRPARIPPDMVERVAGMLAKIRWNKTDVEAFLGQYLSEPKPHVYFDPPRKPLAFARFLALAQRHGIKLDARTQMLYSRNQIHVNGEAWDRVEPALQSLADRRELDLPAELNADTQEALYEWYRCGFVQIKHE